MPNTTNPVIKKLLAQHKARWAVLPDGRQEALIERRTRRLFVQGNGKPITHRKTPNPSSAKDFRANFVEHAKDVEDFVPLMYQDVKRNVTVGFGHLIRNERGASPRAAPFAQVQRCARPGFEGRDKDGLRNRP